MARILFLIVCSVIAIAALPAQVGINTVSPIGIFNIDALGNNPASNPHTSNRLNDDIIFRVNQNNEANLIVGGSTLSSASEASLELNETNKAMLLNRVSLSNAVDVTTVDSPQDGMIVYNTSTSGSDDDMVVPSVYMNQKKRWLKFSEYVESPASTSKILTLSANQTSTLLTNPDLGTGALSLRFNNLNEIPIAEDGRYIFTFRLYGGRSLNTASSYGYGEYYLYLFRSNGGNETLISKTQMAILEGYSTFYTYTPTLFTPFLSKGESVIVKIGHISNTRKWTLIAGNHNVANHTSLVFWKLK